MTDHGHSTYIATIQACEAAIARVRAAIRAGAPDTETVGNDLVFIQEAVEDRLVAYALKVRAYGPQAFEEALDALRDRLLDDIWSVSYQTMETQFGAYLNTRPLRVLQQIARKYGRTAVSFPVERLDRSVGEEGQPLGDTIADPLGSAAIDQIAEDDEQRTIREQVRAAIATFPPEERFVVQQRMAGVSNNAIARRLGVSVATASRMYTRALERLRAILAAAGSEA